MVKRYIKYVRKRGQFPTYLSFFIFSYFRYAMPAAKKTAKIEKKTKINKLRRKKNFNTQKKL